MLILIMIIVYVEFDFFGAIFGYEILKLEKFSSISRKSVASQHFRFFRFGFSKTRFYYLGIIDLNIFELINTCIYGRARRISYK